MAMSPKRRRVNKGDQLKAHGKLEKLVQQQRGQFEDVLPDEIYGDSNMSGAVEWDDFDTAARRIRGNTTARSGSHRFGWCAGSGQRQRLATRTSAYWANPQ